MKNIKELTDEEMEEYLKYLAGKMGEKLPPFEEVWARIKDKVALDKTKQ